jgi:hypothetical protein
MLSRQSVHAIPSKRPCYTVKASMLYRAFRLARAAGLNDLPHDMAGLARRVVWRGLDGVGSGFIVRQETNPLEVFMRLDDSGIALPFVAVLKPNQGGQLFVAVRAGRGVGRVVGMVGPWPSGCGQGRGAVGCQGWPTYPP